MTTEIKQIAIVPHGLSPNGTIAITVQMPPEKAGFVIDDMTDVIALAGLLLALASALIAWGTYLRSKEESRLAHVNGLFREMLAMEYDFQKTAFDDPIQRRQTYYRLMSHKMWVLEEMWLWLQDYKSEWRRPWFNQVRRNRHKDAERNWQATIENHISRREEWHFKNVDKSAASYVVGFRDLVNEIRQKKAIKASSAE